MQTLACTLVAEIPRSRWRAYSELKSASATGVAMNTVSHKSGAKFSRRRFLAETSVLGAASFLGLSRLAAAEPPPETTRVRIVNVPAICLAPQYLAEELLRLEGFTDIEYVSAEETTTNPDLLVANRADISAFAPSNLLPFLDAGKAVVALAGLHGGCYELFAHEQVRTIRDLKGKRVAVTTRDGLEYYYIAAIAAYVGMDPRKDID